MSNCFGYLLNNKQELDKIEILDPSRQGKMY